MYQNLYQFGWDRAKEQSKSIDGLSGQEEHDAIETIEAELDEETMESMMDDDSDEEEESHDIYNDEGGYN
jgi:uncharacterized membrane protein YukC